MSCSGKTGATFNCSRCKTTSYCGVSCQKLDWKCHKEVCSVVKKQGDEDAKESDNEQKSEHKNGESGRDIHTQSKEFIVLEGKPPIRLSESKFTTKKEQYALAKHNKDVIVEIRNCAMFLAAALAMVGQKGSVSFDKSLEIREDVATKNPILSTFGNFTTPPNISPRILGKPIGKEGKRVTYDDILSMLRDIPLRAEEDTGYLQSPVYARHPDR